MKRGVCEGVYAGMDPCLSQCEDCARKYGVAKEVNSFPVTDPDEDAPDGAVVDGWKRVGSEWVRL